MIHLPKPSALRSTGDIEILPRTALPSQLPPHSTTQPSYRFNLTALPSEKASTIDADLLTTLNRLLTLSQHLTIPTLFASGDGQAWTHSAQHYPALLAWREQQVPSLLAEVGELLGDIDPSKTVDSSEAVQLVVRQVVCAVARYLPLGSEADDAEAALADGWTSDRSTTAAKSILSNFSPQSSRKLHASPTIEKTLLVDYIKPIFREASSSSSAPSSTIDPSTGRSKPPPPGSQFISHLDANLGKHRFASAAEDSSASNLVPQRFTLRLADETVEERNEALGCVNVLAWCLEALQLEMKSEWTEVWPLIVPPMLTLLEHPQPRLRAQGSGIVLRLLGKPRRSEEDEVMMQRRDVVLGKLLVRTGIGSLLECALHVNLTYIHDEMYAARLLSHSLAALRQLIMLTTDPIVYQDPGQDHTEGSTSDCGQRRTESLFKLISEGILSTWSYLPIPPSGTHLGRRLVNVTCAAFLQLIDDLSPSPSTIGGEARFLDVSLDWICRSWLSQVPLDHTEQVRTTVAVLRLAKRLLVRPAKRFTGLVLAAVAKCYISAQESHLRSGGGVEWEQMEGLLSTLLHGLSETDSTVQVRWSELVKLDPRLSALLPAQ